MLLKNKGCSTVSLLSDGDSSHARLIHFSIISYCAEPHRSEPSKDLLQMEARACPSHLHTGCGDVWGLRLCLDLSNFVASSWHSVVWCWVFLLYLFVPSDIAFMLPFHCVQLSAVSGVILSHCWWKPNISWLCCFKVKAFLKKRHNDVRDL